MAFKNVAIFVDDFSSYSENLNNVQVYDFGWQSASYAYDEYTAGMFDGIIYGAGDIDRTEQYFSLNLFGPETTDWELFDFQYLQTNNTWSDYYTAINYYEDVYTVVQTGLYDPDPAGVAQHGDWVLDAFFDQLDDPNNTEVIAIDIDFTDFTDWTYLFDQQQAPQGFNSWFEYIVADFYQNYTDPSNTYIHMGLSASLSTPSLSTSQINVLSSIMASDAFIFQAIPNVSSSGMNWSEYFSNVINVGAYNVDIDGTPLFGEISQLTSADIFADGLVYGSFILDEGWNFGTSFATPRVAAETLNYFEEFVLPYFENGENNVDDIVDLDEGQYTEIVDFIIDEITEEVGIKLANDENIYSCKVLSDDLDLLDNFPNTVLLDSGNDETQIEMLWVNGGQAPEIIYTNYESVTHNNTYYVDFDYYDPDYGDFATFMSNDLPDWLSLDPVSGLVTGTPPDQTSTYQYTISAVDQYGKTSTELIEFSVAGNSPPTFVNPDNGQGIHYLLETYFNPAIEDEKFYVPLTAFDTDHRRWELEFEGVQLPDWLNLMSIDQLDNFLGIWTGSAYEYFLAGTPQNDDVGDNEIVIKVTDPKGASDETEVVIEVVNSNDAPVLDFTPPTETDEDALFSYQLTATDVDMLVTEETLTFSSVNKPDWMTVSSTGLITGTPTNDDVGSHSVTVEVRDSAGATDQKTFTLTVNNINDAPDIDITNILNVLNFDKYIWSGQPLDFKLDATDPDSESHNEELTYQIMSVGGGPTIDWISVDALTGSVSGIAPLYDFGKYNITFRVTDSGGLYDETSLPLVVLDKSEAHFIEPEINGALEVGQAISASLQVLDFDGFSSETPSYQWYSALDPHGLGKSVLGPGVDGSFQLNAEQYGRYVGFEAYYIDDSGVFEKSEIFWSEEKVDGDPNLNTTAQFDISISGLYEVGQELIANVAVNDPDGFSSGIYNLQWWSADTISDPSSSQKVLGPGVNGSFFLNPEEYGRYVGVEAYFIDDSGTFEKSEIFWSDTLIGGSSEGSNKTVFNIELTSDFLSGSLVDININAEDPNGLSNTPLYMWKIGSNIISGNSSIGQAQLELQDSWFGEPIEVIVYVIDDLGNFHREEIQTDKLVLGNIPSFSGEPIFDIYEDEVSTFFIADWLSDPDLVYGDTHVFELIDSPDFIELDKTNGLVTALASQEKVGEGFFSVLITDSMGLSLEKQFLYEVLNSNDAPIFDFTPPASTDEDTPFSYQLTATDVDMLVTEETLTFSSVNKPDWMTVSSDGLITGTPTNDDVGSHTVTVEVMDSEGATDQKTFTLTVNNVNDAPVFDFTPPSSADEDTLFSYQLTATDVDFDVASETLSYEALEKPDWMTVSSDGLITGTPTNDDVGSHSVTVEVTDSKGATDQKTFSLTVNNVNDAPIFDFTPSTETDEDALFSYQLTATDADMLVTEETLTFSSVSKPDWMTVSSGGLITGTPTNDDVGSHSVTVQVRDSEGATEQKTFTVTVNNVNDAPVFDFTPPVSTDEDTPFSYQLTATDVDMLVTEETLTFSLVTKPDWMTVSSDGLISGTPTNDDVGSHSVTVEVTDSKGATDQKTFNLTVNNVNDPPDIIINFISDGSLHINEEQNISLQISVDDEDVGDKHIYSIITNDDLTWLSLDPTTGHLTGIADDNQIGVYSIAFQVEDEAGAVSMSEVFNLEVHDIDEPVYIDEDQSVQFKANSQNSYLIKIRDEDLNDSYTFTANNLPTWLNLDAETGILSGSPTKDDDGIYQVEITVSDSAGFIDTKIIEVTATSFQYTTLYSGDDTFYGEDVADFVETGGGDDHIMAAGGDDHIVVQGAGEVIVDVGSGRDIVEVDPTFVGGLTITNGQETEVEASSLTIVIDKPAWVLRPASDTATNTDYKITLDGGENEILIKDYFFTDEEGYVTTKDISIRHQGWDGWDAGYTGMMWESVRGSNQDNLLYSSIYDRDKTDDYVPVVEDGIVYSMSGFGGDDVFYIGGGLNQIFGWDGDDAFYIDMVGQNTSIIGDKDGNYDGQVPGQYVNPSLKEDGLPDYDTVNTDYGDAAYFSFEWPTLIDNPDFNPNAVEDASNPRYLKDPDSYIEQLGKGHFKVHHKLENGEEINVEMYDVEGAYFSDGEGGLEYHALTSGRPITSDDFGNLAYDRGDVKFWVEHNDADYGGATTIAVVTTATKTVTDPVTKQKISYEEPSVKWKGLATEADSFVFSDVTINVINVAQTDLTGVPIDDTTVYGTAGIDLIIGDDSDNLIYGGANNDIIFGGAGNDEIYGEGGDDVLIGGVGEDILYGDYHEDALKPAEELDSKGKLMNASELDGDDIIVGGAGIDKIDSGEGQNIAASGDLSSVILNAELDEMHTFLDYDEDDLPV